MTLVDADTGEIVQTLESCEAVIENGLRTFVEVGNALITIRDAKLYRAGHDTFEAYCDERWGLKRQRAYELIEAAQVASAVSEISDMPPLRESHAAALAPLKDDPAAAAEAMRTASDVTGGKPTAKAVKQAVELSITQKRAIAVTKYPWLDVLAPAQQIINTATALDGYKGKELEQRIETSKKWAAAQTRKQQAPAPKADDTAAIRDVEQALDSLVRWNVEAERALRALADHPHLLDNTLDQWTDAIASARLHLDDLTPVPGLRRVK